MADELEKQIALLYTKQDSLKHELWELGGEIYELEKKNYVKNLKNLLSNHLNAEQTDQIISTITEYSEGACEYDSDNYRKIYDWRFIYDCSKDSTLTDQKCLFCEENKKYKYKKGTEHKIDLTKIVMLDHIDWNGGAEDYLEDIDFDSFDDSNIINHPKHGPIHIIEYIIVRDNPY